MTSRVADRLVDRPPADDPAPEAEVPPGPLTSRGRTFIAAGCIAVFALRAVMGWMMAAPHVVADELGYLAPARWWTGNGAIELVHSTFYHPGYSVLITPAQLFSSDPGTVYRLALTINALLGALIFLATYATLVRVFAIRRGAAWAGAAVASLYPGVLGHTAYAWSENALPLLVLALVVVAHRYANAPTAAGASLVAGVAGIAYVLHPRLLLAMGVALVVVGLVALSGRGRAMHLAPAVAITAATYVIMRVVRAALLHALYTPNDRISEDAIFDRLIDVDLWPRVGAVMLGQAWYLQAGTFGLFAVGLFAAVRHAWPGTRWRDLRRAQLGEPRVVAVLTLGMLIASLWIVTGLLLAKITRFDQLFYGRYIEITTPLVLGLAVAAIVNRYRGVSLVAGASALLTGLLTLALAQAPMWNDGLPMIHPMALAASGPVRFFSERGATFADGELVMHMGLWAAGLALVLAVLTRVPAAAIPLAASGLLAVALYTFTQGSIKESDRQTNTKVFTDEVMDLAGASPVGYVAHPGGSVYIYQWFEPDLVIDGETPHLREFVLAHPDWPAGADRGYLIVALDPARGEAIWQRPGERQAALDRAAVDYPTPFPGELDLAAQQAAIELVGDGDEISVPSGFAAPVEVRVTHLGSGQRWPSFDDRSLGDSRGRVRVAVRILDGQDTVTEGRIDLAAPMGPGDAQLLRGHVNARLLDGQPLPPGRYEVQFAMIQEVTLQFAGPHADALTVPLIVT